MANSKEELQKQGIVTVCGVVETKKIDEIVQDIIYLNTIEELGFITLLLNSPGGSCDNGFMLVDVIEYSQKPIHITGLGICASMGMIILCSGHKGGRVITKNTTLLSHQYSWQNCGKHHELVAAQKEREILQDKFIKHYKKHTGLSVSKIKKHLLPASDVWLSPTEAMELNLVDKVID